MAYRKGNRRQATLFPSSLEEYVSEDSPVRVYDAFVDSLDLNELGITVNEWKVGNSSYHPLSMLKLLVYGYSYGIRSSRKLERAVHDNVSFIWLLGGLKPDHKTISEFRRKNKKALGLVLKQSVRLCIKLGLIAGNILFVDGSKMKANASRKSFHDANWYAKRLKEIDCRIEALLEECERVDAEEKDSPDLVTLSKELSNSKKIKEKVQKALTELNKNNRKNISTSDPESRFMGSSKGSDPSYNVQHVVDDEHGLIVQAEATTDATDKFQFANQISEGELNVGKYCEAACADAGYSYIEELAEMDRQGTYVVVPTHQQASGKEVGKFDKREFIYEAENDRYICPRGFALEKVGFDADRQKREYRIRQKGICKHCEYFGECTKSESNRIITRMCKEEVYIKIQNQYASFKGQEIYRKRKNRAELPFGHIKRNLGAHYFHLRGQAGVQAETSLLATCFNISRLLSLKGALEAISELKSLSYAV